MLLSRAGPRTVLEQFAVAQPSLQATAVRLSPVGSIKSVLKAVASAHVKMLRGRFEARQMMMSDLDLRRGDLRTIITLINQAQALSDELEELVLGALLTHARDRATIALDHLT